MNIKSISAQIGKIISLLLVVFSTFSYSQVNTCQNYTLTIGGWGNENPSNPNYQLLHNNFAAAFPSGLTVGCPAGYTVKFTNPQAISDFLPSSGSSGPLTQSYVNPSTGNPANTLLSQLIAVKLAVGIDAVNPNYSPSNNLLGNQMFVSGPFEGKTVNYFLMLADNFMGGCGSSEYTAAQFNDAAQMINENYDAGANLGNLTCCRLKIVLQYDPIKCYNGTTEVTVTAVGGSSSTQGTGTFTVGPGTHKFTITDGDCTDSAEITLENPSEVVINHEVTKEIACKGGTGTVKLTFSGGTSGKYDIYWDGVKVSDDDADGVHIINEVAANIKHTYYAIDCNGCESKSGEVTLSEPEALVVTASAPDIKCHGEKSEITFNITGGTQPYTLTIHTPSGDVVVDNLNDNVYKYPNAGAGSYTYEVTDAHNCNDSGDVPVVINEPTELKVSANQLSEIKCHGDLTSVEIKAEGGTGPYDIYWGTTLVSENDADGLFTVPNIAASDAAYSFKVVDANGCEKNGTIKVDQPTQLKASAVHGDIKCNGDKTFIKLSLSGGTAPYRIFVTGNDVAFVSNLSAGDYQIDNVGAGTYNYTVKDNNNCTVVLDPIVITQPDPVTVKVEAPDVLCFGGTALVTATASGGTAPYTYSWQQNGTEVAAGSSVNLQVGNYTLVITDAKGCGTTANVTVKLKSCGGFTTVTQGGWGAPANGKNWGSYRDNNFVTAFPSGLTVGAGTRWLKLTSAKAVENFLPSGGTPRMLNVGTLVNPTEKSYKNTLAGQVVALTLSLGFDAADANFSTSASPLGNQVVISGTFAGWTVSQVLAEANKVLGGLPSSYTVDQMNAVVDMINNNYDGGTKNNGNLACPCESTSAPVVSNELKPAIAPVKDTFVEPNLTVYPNPNRGEFSIKLENADLDGTAVVQLYNLSGKLMDDLSSKVSKNGNTMSMNYSNSRLPDGMYLLVVKTSTFQKSFKVIIRK